MDTNFVSTSASGNATINFMPANAKWNFCPECGRKREPDWNFCPFDATNLARPMSLLGQSGYIPIPNIQAFGRSI